MSVPGLRLLFEQLLVLRFGSLGSRRRFVHGLLLDPVELGLLLRFDRGDAGRFGVLLGLFGVAPGLVLRGLRLALLLDLRVAAVDLGLLRLLLRCRFFSDELLLARRLKG